MSKRERYLGDGVYATYDGDTLTLDLRGQDNTTRIVLDTDTVDALLEFLSSIELELRDVIQQEQPEAPQPTPADAEP